jgi:hypothetical protein
MILEGTDVQVEQELLENYEHNVSEAIAMLPSLCDGVDVNVKFGSSFDFEFTRVLTIFDVLQVPLVHGWLVDPQDHDAWVVLHELTYNQAQDCLVAAESLESSAGDLETDDCLICFDDAKDPVELTCCHSLYCRSCLDEFFRRESAKASPISCPKCRSEHPDVRARTHVLDTADMPISPEHLDENGELLPGSLPSPSPKDLFLKHRAQRQVLEKSLIVSAFLRLFASQLTPHGIRELHRELPEGALVAFFRNNHVSVMHKHGSQLCVLLTDLGYLECGSKVCWERLDDIHGDNQMLDDQFTSQQEEGPTEVPLTPEDEDYRIAMQLQQEEYSSFDMRHYNLMNRPISMGQAGNGPPGSHLAVAPTDPTGSRRNRRGRLSRALHPHRERHPPHSMSMSMSSSVDDMQVPPNSRNARTAVQPQPAPRRRAMSSAGSSSRSSKCVVM